MVGSPTSEEILPLWERNEYGFGILCRYAKAIGKYGFPAGMSVPNNPCIRGIAWYPVPTAAYFRNLVRRTALSHFSQYQQPWLA